MTYEQATMLLKKNGQEQILRYWKKLSAAERKALLAQIESIDFKEVKRCQSMLPGSGVAVEAVKKGNRHVSLSQMSFGYPGKENGKFCRYKITYNGKTDSVTVSR